MTVSWRMFDAMFIYLWSERMFSRFALLLCFMFASGFAQAANVAFFNDGAFVDSAQEGLNLRTTLVNAGHTVTDISGTTLGDFTAGLAGKVILVIPELQNGDLFAALDAPTRTLIANFVNSGGTIQVHGGTTPNDVSFLNGIFGYTLATNGTLSAGSSTLTAAAAGTQFATAPATITNNSAVTRVATAALPAGAKSIYTPDAGTNSVLFFMTQGSGQVIFMGWDWYNAPPQGAADGGWLAIANLISVAAVATAASASSSTAVPTLSEWGMIMLTGLMALFGIVHVRRRNGIGL